MIVFLASPNTQQQAEHVAEMPVLLSYACYPKGRQGGAPWMDDYLPSFGPILIDSGAFSEFNTGTKVDLDAYSDWVAMRGHLTVAVAGLDDISGDWRRSLANYERLPAGFPTMHETDPDELLDDLIALSRERPQGGSGNRPRPWLGIGLLPSTRQAKGGKDWLRGVLDRVPDDIHVHGWAARAYTGIRRFDSVDSTNWWRDAMKLRTNPDLAHLTYGETLEILVKKYQRWERVLEHPSDQTTLFRREAS